VPDIELDTAVDELYAGPREEFVPRRKELAKAARAAGDAEVAARIEKLAKPTTAAWLANRLARTAGADVRALAELGDALRQAHERLDGAEIRELTQRRAELIRELLRTLEEQEQTLTESVTRELEEIFTKAVADEEVGAALVSGRLTSAKAFAPMSGWPSLPAGKVPAPPPRAKPQRRDGADDARRRERAQEALDEARAAVKEAEAARAEDERALADAEAAAAEAAAEVSRLSEELDAAEAREKRARGLVAMARRSVKEAERRAAQAWRQVQVAEAKLAEAQE
jgi:predicted  nucleic acid-binding Zn-ribbon protein